jgi:hypothetical protein
MRGSVSWFTVQHGPSAACRALNVGISLFPEYRGRGYGTRAQRLLSDYLVGPRLIERVEAATDVENFAEQRALENRFLKGGHDASRPVPRGGLARHHPLWPSGSD